MEKNTEKEPTTMSMEIDTSETGSETRKTVMESFNIIVELFMMENGLTIRPQTKDR